MTGLDRTPQHGMSRFRIANRTGSRAVPRIFACLVLLGSVAFASAQTAPFLAEVTAESVPLRSGPGDQMPDTGALFRGAKVVVDHEDGENWVAIQPPRGQVSWVKHLNLGPVDGQADVIPRNAIVHADPDAEIALGKPGLGRPLDVQRTRVPDQTIVLIIGNKVEHRGSQWYPIEPPDGDFRYVPKSALRFLSGQPSQSFVVRSPKPEVIPLAATATVAGTGTSAPAPLASISPPNGSGNTSPRGENWPNHPLWRQAEDADRRGDYAQAEQLYLKLASQMNQPGGDADLANLCYTRVHAVRERQRQTGGKPAPNPNGGAVQASESRWAGPGILREAGFRFDRRTTYALVSPQGRVICYAIPGPGVNLDRFVKYEVELYGSVDFPGDLRGAGVMTCTQVRAAK